jgi:hypothetical protein
MGTRELKAKWRRHYRTEPQARLSRDLLIRAIAYKIQERAHGGLSRSTKRRLVSLAKALETEGDVATEDRIRLKSGAKLVREWRGETYRVTVCEDGFELDGRRYRSLSKIAQEITGVHWSGPRFFGLERAAKPFAKKIEARRG